MATQANAACKVGAPWRPHTHNSAKAQHVAQKQGDPDLRIVKVHSVPDDSAHNPRMKEHLNSDIDHCFQLEGISESKQCPHLRAEKCKWK